MLNMSTTKLGRRINAPRLMLTLNSQSHQPNTHDESSTNQQRTSVSDKGNTITSQTTPSSEEQLFHPHSEFNANDETINMFSPVETTQEYSPISATAYESLYAESSLPAYTQRMENRCMSDGTSMYTDDMTSNFSGFPSSSTMSSPQDAMYPLDMFDGSAFRDMSVQRSTGRRRSYSYQQDIYATPIRAQQEILTPSTPRAADNDQNRIKPTMSDCKVLLGNEGKPQSYAQLISYAIACSPLGKLTLSEIYDWCLKNFPYFKKQTGPGWKNSIRHNLSLNKSFVKVPRPVHEPGKGSYWALQLDNSTNRSSSTSHSRNRRRSYSASEIFNHGHATFSGLYQVQPEASSHVEDIFTRNGGSQTTAYTSVPQNMALQSFNGFDGTSYHPPALRQGDVQHPVPYDFHGIHDLESPDLLTLDEPQQALQFVPYRLPGQVLWDTLPMGYEPQQHDQLPFHNQAVEYGLYDRVGVLETNWLSRINETTEQIPPGYAPAPYRM